MGGRLVRTVERWACAVGAVLVASGAFHLIVFVAGDRAWDGPLSWRKPATFGLSFGTTLVSVAWVASNLQLSERLRAWLLGAFAADCVLEVSGITIQAWRDVPSHFNNETPFDAVIAYSLAFGGGVLVVVLGALALTAFRGRIDGPPSMRLALRAGFALLVAGLLAGVAMIVRGTILVRTGHRTDGYDDAGFLKAFHAVTLHAVLVLPALAWWLTRRRVAPSRATRVVAAGVGAYVVAAVAVLIGSVVAL